MQMRCAIIVVHTLQFLFVLTALKLHLYLITCKQLVLFELISVLVIGLRHCVAIIIVALRMTVALVEYFVLQRSGIACLQRFFRTGEMVVMLWRFYGTCPLSMPAMLLVLCFLFHLGNRTSLYFLAAIGPIDPEVLHYWNN